MALSYSQLVTLAQSAGFGKDSDTAAAIALAESGGDPTQHNTKPPDNSYGLMQINMLGALGPDRRKRFNLKSNDDLFNPSTNMRVAYGIYQANGFHAWTTYTSGKYKEFLKGGKGGGNTLEDIATLPVTAPTAGVEGAVNAFGATLFKTGANIAGVIIAVVLLILGVLLLARSQVAGFLPAGKAAKIAKGVLK
jgi:hypothetical protein